MAPKARQKELRLQRNRIRNRTHAVDLEFAEHFRERVSDLGENVVFSGKIGLPKLSARLLKVVEPLTDQTENDQDYEETIQLGILAWNFSLLPEEGQTEFIREMAAQTQAFWADFMSLVGRKCELFPDDDRIILDYMIVGTGPSRRLLVGFAMDPEALPAGQAVQR